MNNMKLTLLFESVVNSKVDLTSYPDLKKIVDLYTPVKIQGNYVIRPDDFNTLLNGNDKDTQEVLALISRGQLGQNLNNNTPQYRVYNFYSGLRDKLRNPQDPKHSEYIAAFGELGDLLTDISKNRTTSGTNSNNSNNSNSSNKKMNLNDTLYLKDNATVEVGDQVYEIDDAKLSVFVHHKNDPNVMKYFNAMYRDNLTLPDDASSDEGLVYTLFKKLKTNCTILLRNQASIDDKLGNNKNNDKKGISSTNLRRLQSLEFYSLHNRAQIKLTYKLYNKNGLSYSGGNTAYESTFTYFDLVGNEKFVNKKDKNNDFIFAKGKVPSAIEQGKKYEVIYNTDEIIEANLFMEIIGIETTEIIKNDFSAFKPCSAMDELIDLLKLD